MAKTTVEKISNIEAEIRQLENERKRLLQRQKEQARKDRTHRLIERGALLESFIDDADALTNDQLKAFLEKTLVTEFVRRALNAIRPTAS